MTRIESPGTSETAVPAGSEASGTRETGMSRVVMQDRYGSPEVLSLVRVPTPTPAPGEVLVNVKASSVNARDWHVMRGEPRLARLAARDTFGMRRPRVAVRGTDLAGVVEAVGSNVTTWRPGERVFGEGAGTFADHALAPAGQLTTIPDGVTFEQAATLPLAAGTAALLLDAADPAPGSSILINGASGGVGTFAIQLAKARDLVVTAVVSPRNTALARQLGADHVIDYTSTNVTETGRRYEAVVDLVGNYSLKELRRTLLPGGSLVLSGGGVSGKGRNIGPMRLLVWAQIAGRLTGLRVLAPQAAPDASAWGRLAALVADGTVTPVIDRTFTLGQSADAIRFMETEHARAKVVITVD